MVTRFKLLLTNKICLIFPFQVFVILLAGFILFACNPQEPESITPTSTEKVPTLSAGSQAVVTASPTPTSEITPLPSQNLVVLIATPNADVGLVNELETTLSELAASAGLDFEVRQSLLPQDLSPAISLVVAVPPDPGLVNLVGATPNIQFLAVSIPGLEPTSNLSVIDTQDLSPDSVAFVAGYLAAMVTPEWRVGTISFSDTIQGVDARQGFLNGAIFFCGLCRQTYPPFHTYPMYVEASSGSNPQVWRSAADFLIDRAVQTVFIPPDVGDDDLLEYLTAAEINIIGTHTPPPGTHEHWIATITWDVSASVRAAWPDLVAGNGGTRISSSLAVMDINPSLLSSGRQRLVEDLISEITSGFIDTGVGATPNPQ